MSFFVSDFYDNVVGWLGLNVVLPILFFLFFSRSMAPSLTLSHSLLPLTFFLGVERCAPSQHNQQLNRGVPKRWLVGTKCKINIHRKGKMKKMGCALLAEWIRKRKVIKRLWKRSDTCPFTQALRNTPSLS
ncbi:MAG: hypothetical protein J3R72DRAFT_157928 [Linnemannia gamsii]|nr:MAG: hypothetical protein J3R72DRAFT_157928 [Linnemannia gamsii]